MKKTLVLLALILACASNAFAAVTVTFQRSGHTNTAPMVVELATATMSGTYATGGFTWTPAAVVGGPGSSPLTQRTVKVITFISPSGYTYVTTMSGTTATTKIYSAPGTELTNGTTVPDTTATAVIYLTQ